MRRAKAQTILLAVALASLPGAHAQEPLQVHQWSIFTILQDENGKEIGGINIDDSPGPESLDGIVPGSLLPVGEGGEINAERPRCHAEVAVRLEKAVVNFYPTSGSLLAYAKTGLANGWLTQFHPIAEVKFPG